MINQILGCFYMGLVVLASVSGSAMAHENDILKLDGYFNGTRTTFKKSGSIKKVYGLNDSELDPLREAHFVLIFSRTNDNCILSVGNAVVSCIIEQKPSDSMILAGLAFSEDPEKNLRVRVPADSVARLSTFLSWKAAKMLKNGAKFQDIVLSSTAAQKSETQKVKFRRLFKTESKMELSLWLRSDLF